MMKKITMPKVIAFDFDNTMDIKGILPYPTIGCECLIMLNVIKTHILNGDIIILNTMREGDNLDAAISWLKDRGIVPDAVNDNCEQRKSVWDNNPRKIGCDISYDDKNFNWNSSETFAKLREFVGKENSHSHMVCGNCEYWENENGTSGLNEPCMKIRELTKYYFWCKDWREKGLLIE